MQNDDTLQLTASSNATTLFRLNPGLTFNRADLQAIQAGTLVPVGPGIIVGGGGALRDFGCIRYLRYGDNDNDLVQVEFDSGEVLNLSNCANLNDFRQRLQEAANFGFGVTACLDKKKKRLFMLNLYPCQCKCDTRG